MSKSERTIVELQYNCVEGRKWDVVAMQNDMIKAYGKDYVVEVKDEEIISKLKEAVEYAEENGVSVPKNINVGRFLARIDAVKENVAKKSESENSGVNETQISAELKEEIEAFEKIKSEFTQEKADFKAEVEAYELEVEEFEKRLEEFNKEKEEFEAAKKETETSKESVKDEEPKADNKKEATKNK